jgi:hypothetical protein
MPARNVHVACRPAGRSADRDRDAFSAVVPRSSITCTVNVNVPAVVGVPLIVFSRFGSSRPRGSSPDTTD